MIITDEHISSNHTDWYSIPDSCFFCHEKLARLPLIMWYGSEKQIWLHPHCSKRFGLILTTEAMDTEDENYV